jgi:hypothetical protein
MAQPQPRDPHPLVKEREKEENHLALLHLASGLIAFKKAYAATPATALPG